jgi:lipopolysaccharide/colanic/teichoic acid biosynthesis glycosyltransferase
MPLRPSRGLRQEESHRSTTIGLSKRAHAAINGSMNTTVPDRGFPWTVRSYRGKRALDIACALVGMALSAPLMVLTAIAVKTTSSGPVFYYGFRAGRCGRQFRQLKFRTMVTASDGGAFTAKGDPRITPLGHILRFIKLDELPQLFNVLGGQMSMVGPRPEDASVVTLLYNPTQLRVLSVRPGLTGEVQLRFFPDLTYEIPDSVDPEHYYRSVLLPTRLQQDLEYVDRMSLWLDLKIIVQTIYTIVFRSWVILWRRRSAAGPR